MSGYNITVPVALVLCAVSCAQQAAAAPADDILYLDIFKVITASRLYLSPQDAPAPVTLIDRETIRASGFTEIHDLFRLVPGFQVADLPSGSPLVVNHGLGDERARRLLVMVDGQSVLNPLWGNVDWQELPLRIEDIERIEVVRGPNQATYGAEAFQGVVNIITVKPGQEKGITAVMRYGKNDLREVYLRTGGEAAGMDWRLSGSAREAVNFRVLEQSDDQRHEEIDRYTLNLKGVYRPNLLDEWSLQLGLVQGGDLIGSPANHYTKPLYNIDYSTELLQLGWQRLNLDGSQLALQFFHFGRQQDSRYEVLPIDPELTEIPSIPVDLGASMARDQLQFQHNLTLRPQVEAAWGGSVRRDAVKSDHYLYGQGEVSGYQWQVFGDLSWRFHPDWLLNLGGTTEKHYNTDVMFSPRLALNHRLHQDHVLRVSAGRGYRAPSIHEESGKEAYSYPGGIADVDFWDNLDLEPERLDFIEMGYLGEFPRLGLKVDARLFAEDYQDYIDNESCVLDPDVPTADAPLWSDEHGGLRSYGTRCPFSPPQGYARPAGFPGRGGWQDWLREDGLASRFGHFKAFSYYNSDELRVRGADITLDWRSKTLGRFLLSHAITRISAHGHTGRDAEESAPRRSSSLLWSRSWSGGLSSSIGYYNVGGFKWPGGDIQAKYTRWDLRLAKRLGKPGSRDEIALTLQNLNAEHAEFRPEYRVERRAFVSVELSW